MIEVNYWETFSCKREKRNGGAKGPPCAGKSCEKRGAPHDVTTTMRIRHNMTVMHTEAERLAMIREAL